MQGSLEDGPIHQTGSYADRVAARPKPAPEYKPQFAPLSAHQMAGGKNEVRRVRVPSHRPSEIFSAAHTLFVQI